MIRYLDPLASQICLNMLIKEITVATQNIKKVDADSLSVLAKVEDQWLKSV